jgi:two-component system response regulator NreC
VKPYCIILADDHAMFRQGIRKILEDEGLRIIAEAKDGFELLRQLEKSQSDLVILDISMPNLQGLEAAREINKAYPATKILFLTMHRRKDFLRQAITMGAAGFLLKEDAHSELLTAIQQIREGKRYVSPVLSDEMTDIILEKNNEDPLTPRERQVLQLLAEGKSNKDIVALLNISIFTVRRHRDNIMRKLKFKTMTNLIRYAIKKGYVSDDLPSYS